MVKNLIPPFIYEQCKNEKSHGAFRAYTMFIDLSGFTALTRSLMLRGNEGAEQLSIILNDIFAPMVDLVYRRGGIIPYFAGDAFTGVFPLEHSDIAPLSFLQTAQEIRKLFDEDEKKNQFGTFPIGIKIGLSLGEVEWGIIGEAYKQFYFRGEAIDDCADCEHFASGQDIVFHQKLLKDLQGASNIQHSALGNYCYKLEQNIVGDFPIHKKKETVCVEEEVMRHFLPQAIIDFKDSGEFRTVVSVFISFDGLRHHDMLEAFICIVLEQVDSFSAYFKEVDFGDKGGLMPFFFGAPTSYENNVRRALEFVLNVYEQTTALQDKGLVLRAGISSGIAYAGIIGGASRSQYAILGNPVNLAARLTMKACWGQIRVDENVQKNPSFHFEFVESIHYKGIEEPVATFLLLDKKTDSHVVFSGAMVGRDEELGALLSFVEDSFLKGKAHITYIFGEAGVGKSRLAFELKNALEKNKDFYWFACPADQILHKPFSPFLSLLKDFFEQHADNKPEQNRQNFERIFQSLLQQLTALPGEQYLSTKKELLRTKSILAAQLGIYYQGSLWSSLDAQGRYQNTLIAYKNYIEATALLKPLVLEIGDAHWYDTDSIGLLNALGKQLQDFPITFLVTSRYLDDGSKPMLFHNDILASVLTQAFDLNMLSAQAVRYFAEDKLGGATSESFHSFLMKISNGNPFYLEQILTYLQECQSIHKQNGQWNADTATLSLPNSMNAVLVARIDRLSKLVKETVKAAAVIGREFELPVLSEVMMQSEPNYQKKHNADTLLKQQVQKAEEGQIWSAISELRYIFKHALLRETIYDMQLHSRLRKLHLLIGSAIEKLYAQRLEEKYVDLAFHFEKAQVIDKTVYYLEKAADFARDNFQNQQAVAFYQKLEKIFKKQKQDKDIVRVLLKKGPVLEMIGEWEVAEENYRQALQFVNALNHKLLTARVHNSLGRILLLRGEYKAAKEYLEKAHAIFTHIDDAVGKFKVLGDLGNFYFRQGNYEEAQICFYECIQKSKSISYNKNFSKIVSSLGLTHMNLGNYREGIDCQLNALKICEQQGDKQGMAALHTNLGIVYSEKGDLDDALLHYKAGLEIAQELGNKQLTAIAIGCIGTVYQQKGAFDLALQNYEEDLQLCQELGDKQGTAIVYGLLGELCSLEGNFEKAIPYLQKQMQLSQKLGYQKGMAKALNSLGDIYFMQHKYHDAIRSYGQAIDLSRSMDNKPVLGLSLVDQGFAFAKLKMVEPAQKVLREATELLHTLDHTDLKLKVKILHAQVLAFHNNKLQAIAILEEALGEASRQEDKANIAYELFKLTPERNIYAALAFDSYQRLYQKTPKILFKQRIEVLSPYCS